MFSHFVTIHFLQASTPLLHSLPCLITPARGRHHVISSVTPANPRPPPSSGGGVGSSHQTGQVCGTSRLNPGARALYRQQQEQPLLAQAISRFPDILEKPIHPYRHKGLRKRLRAGLISGHYQQLARQLPKAQQLAIYSGRGLLLAQWQSDKLTAPLTLQLDYQTHMGKEGR